MNEVPQVSSHFYPINSGLFIEDSERKEQMIVMNDRPQAGSAYHPGRIELMFHRVGVTSDELGVGESMRDYTSDNKGINVTAKFFLAFTTSREAAYRMIQKRHILNQNQLQYFYSSS